MSDVIIEFRGIHKRFGGIHAVKGVSFSIEKGEVHTILGENGAGKSTLMNMLSGIYLPDEGEILCDGEPVQITDPYKAKALGISTVFQELKLCPNLTVVQNIFLGRERKKGLGPDWNSMTSEASRKLAQLGMNIDVTKRVMELSAAQRQLVEIARAMFINSRVLILDEPTSSLTCEEAEKLFGTVRMLKEQGVAVIFISHRMQEVFEISDRISIMRNGEYLSTCKIEEVSPQEVVALISGKEREHAEKEPRREARGFAEDAPAALEVHSLCGGPLVRDVSFRLYKGEVLGFYGLQSAGRTELMETVFGLRRAESGEIRVNGKRISGTDVSGRMKNGIAMVPEDRKRVGLFMNFDVMDNMCAMHGRDMVSKTGMLDRKRMRAIAERFTERLRIRTDGVGQMVKDLSGGNQQKVVISKCLSMDPQILIMDEPTRGVDVGAKAEIFDLLHALREDPERPMSIIVVSSELSEVMAECDRVLVMRQGRIVGELKKEEINKDAILQYAFNGQDASALSENKGS